MIKMKSKYVRDRVSTYGRSIKKATDKKFGINNRLILRAVNGDEKALKEIGDLGIAYLSYAKKGAHLELEGFKTTIKLYGVNAREEREFKTQVVKTSWDKERVKSGFISVKAIQDNLKRQQVIQDKTHTSTLKQFTTADSEMDKKIAENLRDKHKADIELHKILGNKNDDIEDNSTNTALKLDENYHWIYTIKTTI